MKKILLFIIGYFVFVSLYAQDPYNVFYDVSPNKPFVYGQFNVKRVLADRVHTLIHNNFNIISEYDSYYKFSNDMLRDTINGNSSYPTYITYYKDGRMKSFKQPASNYFENYIYDDLGRISKVTMTDLQTNSEFIYTNYYYSASVDSLVRYQYSNVHNKWIKEEKNITTYTDFGFTIEHNDYFNNTNNITNIYFNSNGRLTEAGYYDSNSRFIGTKYEYSDNGYTSTSFDKWGRINNKYEYTFNNNGDLVKTVRYIGNGETGEAAGIFLYEIHEYSYFYNESSIATIDNKQIKITPLKHSAQINSNINTSVRVYSITGKLIVSQNIEVGVNDINLNPGVYIFSIDNNSKTIIIK